MERSSQDGPSGFSYDLLDIFPNGLEGGFACLEVRENHSSYGAIYIYIYICYVYRYILFYWCVRLLKIIIFDHF